MSLFRFVREPGDLRAPVLIVAFDSWVDAGSAATGAAARVAADGETIATFDMDELLDYRAHRPVLDVVEGEAKHLAWPELTATLVREAARDLVVLAGPEPDLRWKHFSTDVLELALRLGVVEAVVLGAIPAAVPHTRPVPLIATASSRELLDPEDRVPEGLLRVPAAALSVVQMELAEHGLPTVGFFAQVPHYVSQPFPAGMLVLVERLGRHLGVEFPVGTLEEEVERQRAELDEIVDSRPEVKAYVQQLEAATPEPGLAAGERIPTGDEIAAEVERFLRGARGDGEQH